MDASVTGLPRLLTGLCAEAYGELSCRRLRADSCVMHVIGLEKAFGLELRWWLLKHKCFFFGVISET
jgi:hypothetical protein